MARQISFAPVRMTLLWHSKTLKIAIDPKSAYWYSRFFEVTSHDYKSSKGKIPKTDMMVDDDCAIDINEKNMRPATGKQFSNLFLTRKGYQTVRSVYVKLLEAKKLKKQDKTLLAIEDIDQMFEVYWAVVIDNVGKAIKSEQARIETLKANIAMLQKLKKTLA